MIATLQKLIEALRNELQQYGEMLALLDHQQEWVRLRGADEILHSISAINAQSAAIQTARDQRQSLQRQLAQTVQHPDEATFADLIPALPEDYRPLVNALVQENNELLERVRDRARQNHLLLSQSLELMQRFITALPPQHHPVLVNSAEGMAAQAHPSLYDAIV